MCRHIPPNNAQDDYHTWLAGQDDRQQLSEALTHGIAHAAVAPVTATGPVHT